jgi:hypothetical protein
MNTKTKDKNYGHPSEGLHYINFSSFGAKTIENMTENIPSGFIIIGGQATKKILAMFSA